MSRYLLASRPGIPNDAGFIIGAGDDEVSFRVNCDALYPVGMAFELTNYGSSCRIPDDESLVYRSGDDEVSLRVNCYAVDYA